MGDLTTSKVAVVSSAVRYEYVDYVSLRHARCGNGFTHWESKEEYLGERNPIFVDSDQEVY